MQPLLSFIIPVYKKSPDTFEKCLRSLFDQSYKNIEILAVFDGPDADLEAVAGKYKSVRCFCIPHGGACKARNYGFTHSTGELVSFWDADCFARPEMVKRWVMEFEAKPDCSFVYSGYEFIPEGMGGIASQEFDAYALTCGNYIATMFPMKRDVFPGFDESLKAGHDWDLWLTLSEKGHKGAFIQGSGFVTEYPDRESISGKGWNLANREATVEAIKRKHNIPERSVCVGSSKFKVKALDLAKMIDADVTESPSFVPHKYKMVMNLGFNFDEIFFRNSQKDCLKVQYWFPWDIEVLQQIAHRTAKAYIEVAKKHVDIHFCNEVVSKNRLSEMGIIAEILPLPLAVEEAETALPAEFKVLIDVDDNLMPLFKDLPIVLPYVPMEFMVQNKAVEIKGFSCIVSFHEFPTVDEGIKRFLLNGRNVVSNVQAPYCGYLDWKQDPMKFKKELTERLREMRSLPFNEKGMKYYSGIVEPAKFKDFINGLLANRAGVAA